MSAIALEQLSLTYPPVGGSGEPVHALTGVDLQVDPGERVAIIGPSGGGKSSLLRVLAGLVSPTGGTAHVAGTKLGGGFPRREFYQRVGVVFQDYGLVAQLTPLANVLCGALPDYGAQGGLARFRQEDRERAMTWLETFGIGERANLVSKRLSGGEQQRVGLARMMMQRPQVMLLDEPVSSLDVHWTMRTLELLEQATDEQEACAVMIMHDLDAAQRWATRVVLLEQGRISFDGDPEEGCALFRERLGSTMQVMAKTSSEEGARDGGAAPAALPPHHALPPRWAMYVAIGVALVALYAWAFMGLDVQASKVFGSADKAADFVSRMLPPDTSVTGTLWESILETIQMALWGTTFAAIFALPIATAAAHNISPVWLRLPARFLLNAMRTTPSLIWGLFFVAIVGLGPLPGVLALSFYATGYLGKFYYEGIESIDPKPLVALRAAGASRLQRFRYGVFPQVLPLLASYTIYMFEYNVRAASILGVVGAGGVGFYLYSYLNNFTYQKATTALLMLLALVTVIDAASSRLRAKLIV